jgi:hypothetical protein
MTDGLTPPARRMMAQAVPLGPDDEDKRAFAWDLMKASNDVVVGFARLMSTTCLTAIGVLLSLAGLVDLGRDDKGWQILVMGAACITFLLAALVFSYVVRGRRIDVSPDDYDDVVEQFLSAARQRQRLANLGLGLLALATCGGLVVILAALADQGG